MAGGKGKAGKDARTSTNLVDCFVEMGFPRKMVLKAIEDHAIFFLHTQLLLSEDDNQESLLELLFTYKVIESDPLLDDVNILENWDAKDAGTSNNMDLISNDSDDEGFLQEMSEMDETFESLVAMGFSKDEAKMAITRCETLGDGYNGNFFDHEDNPSGGIKKKVRRFGGVEQGSSVPSSGNHDEPMPLPNPMVGFNLPNERSRSVDRYLPAQAIGPPFFYFENVALAPKGVWTTIKRFLYDIQPEFVDSRFFCAATRKRGYIHNLPIDNRSPLLPLPPKTIFEAFPGYKKWWPSWDTRKQFNCLLTSVAGPKTIEQICCALANSKHPTPLDVQKYVLKECRAGNLVWVGPNKVAPLEPHELEFLLGFPENHTRGICATDRYRSLGNSFQVHTVAYHLSTLKDKFPDGMNVLSLFSGIGGAEVALHRLGIHMKTVVSVEISKMNRSILKSWWDQTQNGTLIEIDDVQSLSHEKLESLIKGIGGFDLVIGGSPCNNFAGSNRYSRDGLEGEQSSLFYQYFRILDSVKYIMKRN
ncbi:hypothetical protein ACP4OV_015385 [Aristida adscensionis]